MAVPVEVLEATGETASDVAREVVGDITGEEPADVNAQAEHLKTELEAARRDLKAMTAQAMAAREGEARSEAEAGGLRQALEGVRRELHAAQAELRARGADLMEARERAARAEGELAGLRGRPGWRRLWPG